MVKPTTYSHYRFKTFLVNAMSFLTIGILSRATGCKAQTIRYYEDIGLLPRPERSTGNHRLYEPRHEKRLAFIRHARELGFSIENIRDMLSINDRPDQSCEAVDRITQSHLTDVEQRILRLESLKTELQRMLHACKGGIAADCRIIEALADHSHGRI